MADAHFDAKSGKFVLEDGTPVDFLPELPSESAPFEFVKTGPTHADPNHEDGHRHYPIGSDEKTVDDIVEFYKNAGHPVPDGYKDATLAHAAAVKAEADKTKAAAS